MVNITLYLGCRNSTHCLTVTSLIILLLTPVLQYVLRFIWTFCVYCFLFFLFSSVLLFVDLLPSDTVGRFCSVWNILKSFTHLNFRVTEKRQKKKILSILNILTLVQMNKLQIFAFFKKNHKQCIYDRFHINF